jgi:ATP-dependent Clp protease ATP-binding subunit ClpB
MMASSAGGVENPMNPNLYTEAAWNSIQKLPGYGDKYGAQFVEAIHLLKSLLDDGPSGLTQRILFKAGVDSKAIDKSLEEYIKKQPRVSDTANKSLAKSAVDCLKKANDFKAEFTDQFISVEHLLLAAASTDGFTKRVFVDAGSSVDKLKAAAMQIRGSNKVTSRNPENSYE